MTITQNSLSEKMTYLFHYILFLFCFVVVWGWSGISSSFIWNIFLYPLIMSDFFVWFYELGKTATSPNFERVALCRSDFGVDCMCSVSLVGQIKPKQLCIMVPGISRWAGWEWCRLRARWPRVCGFCGALVCRLAVSRTGAIRGGLKCTATALQVS